FKYNMTDVAAAIGLWQLRKQERFHRRRVEIVEAYTLAFGAEEALEPPVRRPHVEHAWHLYALRIRPNLLRIARERFIDGLPALEALLDAGAPIRAVLTLTPELAAKRSGPVDYAPVCADYGVPLHYICGINEPRAFEILSAVSPDVLFVIGWHQIVRQPVMGLPRLGLIGAHASLLPHNRGSAPVNWAIMRGERESGNTLMWLADGVDEGDIIDQRAFSITRYDTCASVYTEVAASNRAML